nr:PhzF family phenazine biosynthesis protein [uncultured Holophaga sp.]
MKRLRFKKIDAFAARNSAGNPAAVVYLERQDELSDAEKLQIARELKGFVSEVGYVSPGTETDYELCYFSAEREVAFCGHATIAILNDLVASHEALQTRETLTIATRSSRLEIQNRYRSEKCVYISAPAPTFSRKTIGQPEVARALGTPTDALEPSRPIRIINAGLETLVVPMAGLSPLLASSPDLEELKAFCLQIGVDIVLLYSPEVTFQESRYRTRVFAPTFGYLEDPATGSGNSAFGHYLLDQGLWGGEKLQIEQNGLRHQPNFVHLFSSPTGRGGTRVWFGGGAQVKISGTYDLA